VKETIKHDIQCHKPPTLRAAYWFARKQEMSYLSNNKKQHTLPAKTTATQIAPKQFPVKESRPRNLQEKPKERGKCWYCPEMWSYGHKCNEVKNLLHAIQLQGHSDTEEEGLGDTLQPEETHELEEVVAPELGHLKEKLMSISATALEGIPGDETISLLVTIAGHQAIALVDSGSFSTFMDYDFAIKLNLQMRDTQARQVTVAGGGTLVTNAMIQKLPFHIQKLKFSSDFRILPLKGYELVLGVSWLKEHNPTTFD
jgi:hypothetical protein